MYFTRLANTENREIHIQNKFQQKIRLIEGHPSFLKGPSCFWSGVNWLNQNSRTTKSCFFVISLMKVNYCI